MSVTTTIDPRTPQGQTTPVEVTIKAFTHYCPNAAERSNLFLKWNIFSKPPNVEVPHVEDQQRFERRSDFFLRQKEPVFASPNGFFSSGYQSVTRCPQTLQGPDGQQRELWVTSDVNCQTAVQSFIRTVALYTQENPETNNVPYRDMPVIDKTGIVRPLHSYIAAACPSKLDHRNSRVCIEADKAVMATGNPSAWGHLVSCEVLQNFATLYYRQQAVLDAASDHQPD